MLPSPPSFGKAQNEELQRMNQDLNLLSQKLIDLQNANSSKLGSSTFVNNIRESTNTITAVDSGNFAETKLQIMEKLIFKITEIDRCILRNTENTVTEDQENTDPVVKRRASRGLDLATFPTHLHILDRLVDVHTRAQRVAVVVKNGAAKKSAEPNPELTVAPLTPTIPPETKAQLSKLETQVAKLTSQLQESQDLAERERRSLNGELVSMKDKWSKIDNEKAKLSENNDHLMEQIHHLNGTVQTMTKNAQEYENKVKEFEDALAQSKEKGSERTALLEERLEISLNSQEKILHILMSIANKVETHCDSAFLSPEDESSLSSEAYGVLSLLVSCVIKRLDELCDEINHLSASNEELESQIKTYNLERDMTQKDIEQLTFLNNALRTEKRSLENECSKKHIDTNESLMTQMEELREKNRKLHSDLSAATVQIGISEGYKEQIGHLESTVISNQLMAEDEKIKLQNQIDELKEENESYKRRNEQLKQKIRDLSGKSNVDAKEFLESFEEVMKEEMMTMKNAFEHKLKAARAESEETARRHANEIRNLQTLHSSPSGKLSLYNSAKYATKGV